MHTAATPRPYLSRRQKSTCSHVDYATLRKSVSTTDERTTGTTTSRINRKTRAGRAEQCCAPVFNYGRTLGQPSRPAEVTEKPGRSGRAVRCLQRRTSARTAPSVGRTRRKIRTTRVNSTGKQLTDWGSSAMHCVIYIQTTRPEFDRTVYYKVRRS